ncbi:MAG TPA: TIM barrel protein [Candidatus Protoclostridium stercorigallinarum]|uniref:TIM barrel protein n=1 Tax=Candidatus Protoclostridium stercorigallinarum TaxID=2838741 RepID=A0A9D1TQR7_9FIRM|nr:TIM barrel protein [Candidatus Protoclostridium stercorigallinarum]
MLRIGPSGNSLSFYEEGHKRTKEAAAWLHEKGLSAYEYSFGRGVRISEEAAAEIAAEFAAYDIEISSHAPYYTNFANPDDDMIEKSIDYVRQTVLAEKMFGGRRSVFHPASCGKSERREAVARAKANIAKLMEALSDITFDFILCPETMGKLNQIGTVEEIVDFCTLDDRLYPCFDFGHINSYTRGGIKGYDDYKRIIDYTADKLGDKKAGAFHVHFSKIMYGEKGELKHLTFADEKYGPEYEGLAKVIEEYRIEPFVICESDGTQAEDALAMLKMHEALRA